MLIKRLPEIKGRLVDPSPASIKDDDVEPFWILYRNKTTSQAAKNPPERCNAHSRVCSKGGQMCRKCRQIRKSEKDLASDALLRIVQCQRWVAAYQQKPVSVEQKG